VRGLRWPRDHHAFTRLVVPLPGVPAPRLPRVSKDARSRTGGALVKNLRVSSTPAKTYEGKDHAGITLPPTVHLSYWSYEQGAGLAYASQDIMLAPALARQLAAELLAAADQAEGLAPPEPPAGDTEARVIGAAGGTQEVIPDARYTSTVAPPEGGLGIASILPENRWKSGGGDGGIPDGCVCDWQHSGYPNRPPYCPHHAPPAGGAP
jgi:hypothetical protein